MNSPVVSSAQMRDAENAAFARGISAEHLMNQAGSGIAETVQRFFPRPGYCLIFSGKGNNGGDALVAAAHLKRAGWHTDVHLSFPESECNKLLRKKITEFRDTPPAVGAAVSAAALGGAPAPTVILDGLLGLGSKPPLRDPILAACREINRLRLQHNAFVFAVDQPTGLDGDSERPIAIVLSPISRSPSRRRSAACLPTMQSTSSAALKLSRCPIFRSRQLTKPLAARLHCVVCRPRRQFEAHKNQFGRVGIVAGSRGFSGAATMCAWGALRGGAGLVEVFVPENIYEIVTAAAPFESMVKPVRSYPDLLDEKHRCLGNRTRTGKRKRQGNYRPGSAHRERDGR